MRMKKGEHLSRGILGNVVAVAVVAAVVVLLDSRGVGVGFVFFFGQ